MSYGYGRQNPFDERDQPSGGGGGGYGAPPAGPPQNTFGQGPSPYGGGRNNYAGGNNVEMSNMPSSNSGGYGGNSGGYGGNGGNGGGYGGGGAGGSNNGGGGGGGTSILNECSDIDRGIDRVEDNLSQLRNLHRAALGDTDTSSNSRVNRELDGLSSDTMTLYRSLVDRVRQLKSKPESRQPMNLRQVERIDKRLKDAIRQYQEVESEFRRETQGQIARQYKIVKPNASDDEVSRAVDGAEGGQVFTQALMQSNRQGQATAALNNVRDRHAQILKIERQMTELAQLFQDMNTLVVQQEVAVAQIEQKAEEVVDNLDKGNEEINTAVKTAYATRRKKWWCVGITILIIVIIVVAILVWLAVTGQLGGGGKDNNNNDSNNDNNNNDNNETGAQKRSLTLEDMVAIRSGLAKAITRVPRQISDPAALTRSVRFRNAVANRAV